MKEENRQLHIYEIICKKSFNLDNSLYKLIESNKTNSIKFYFPSDQLNFKYDKTLDEDNCLFSLGDMDLNDALFKFPVTAIT